MFRGRFEHTVDSKGRVSFPSRFREILSSSYSDDRLIVTSFVDPCLIAYPLAEWKAIEDKARQLPRFDPKVLQLKRILISGAQECPIDKNGRVLIPPSLREFAQIEKDVVWSGMVDMIELWSKEQWQRMSRDARDHLSDLGPALGSLGL